MLKLSGSDSSRDSVEASVAIFAVESQEHIVSESLNEHIEYSVDKDLMRQDGDGYVGQKRATMYFRFLQPGVLSSSEFISRCWHPDKIHGSEQFRARQCRLEPAICQMSSRGFWIKEEDTEAIKTEL